jgi:DNA polymerase III subunit chi
MQVDFYQLGRTPLEEVIARLALATLQSDERMIVVAEDPAKLARLDRALWQTGAVQFLPHGLAGGPDDARQPVLLSTETDAPNRARYILLADGHWRDAALNFTRAFFLFGEDTLEAARLAWKLLAGRDGVERRYWTQSAGGSWEQKA